MKLGHLTISKQLKILGDVNHDPVVVGELKKVISILENNPNSSILDLFKNGNNVTNDESFLAKYEKDKFQVYQKRKYYLGNRCPH